LDSSCKDEAFGIRIDEEDTIYENNKYDKLLIKENSYSRKKT
jgi:hypothetical protein